MTKSWKMTSTTTKPMMAPTITGTLLAPDDGVRSFSVVMRSNHFASCGRMISNSLADYPRRSRWIPGNLSREIPP